MKKKNIAIGIALAIVILPIVLVCSLYFLFFVPNSYVTIDPAEGALKVKVFINWKNFPPTLDKELIRVQKEISVAWFNDRTERIIKVPLSMQTSIWAADKNTGDSPLDESISFNTADLSKVTADVSLSWKIDNEKLPDFYLYFRDQKSGNLDLGRFVHVFLRSLARRYFNEIGGKYTVEQVYGSDKEQIAEKVMAALNEEISEYGFVIVEFGFYGAPSIPREVEKSINEKISRRQLAKIAEAERPKFVAEAENRKIEARGVANYNSQVRKSLDPLVLIKEAIAKWDGGLPLVISGSESGNGILVSIKDLMMVSETGSQQTTAATQ